MSIEQPEAVAEVIQVAGAHEHPHDHPHEHPELLAEVVAVREEVRAAAMVNEAADVAAGAELAAGAAIEEAYDAKADVAALREEISLLRQELAAPAAAPVIVDPGPPMEEEPEVPEPPVTENRPPRQRKKDNVWW